MNKLKFLVMALLLATFFVSCDNEKEALLPQTQSQFVDIAIPNTYKTNNSTARTDSDEVDDVTIDVKIVTTEGKAVIGKIRFVMPDDGTLSHFSMTENLLTETGLTADYWVQALKKQTGLQKVQRTMGCFSDCRKIPKKNEPDANGENVGVNKGRGECKAGCWLDVAVKAASIVAVIVAL